MFFKIAGLWVGLVIAVGVLLFEVLNLDNPYSDNEWATGIVLLVVVGAVLVGVVGTRRIVVAGNREDPRR